MFLSFEDWELEVDAFFHCMKLTMSDDQMLLPETMIKRYNSDARVHMTETIREKFIGDRKKRGPHWTDWLKDAVGDFCRLVYLLSLIKLIG